MWTKNTSMLKQLKILNNLHKKFLGNNRMKLQLIINSKFKQNSYFFSVLGVLKISKN